MNRTIITAAVLLIVAACSSKNLGDVIPETMIDVLFDISVIIPYFCK